MLAGGSTITGAASTIVKDNLPSNVVLVSNKMERLHRHHCR